MPPKKKGGGVPGSQPRCWNCWSQNHATQGCHRPPLSVKEREELRIELGFQRPNDANYANILNGMSPCWNCWASTEHSDRGCNRRRLDTEGREKLRKKMGHAITPPYKKALEKAGWVVEGNDARPRWAGKASETEEVEENEDVLNDASNKFGVLETVEQSPMKQLPTQKGNDDGLEKLISKSRSTTPANALEKSQTNTSTLTGLKFKDNNVAKPMAITPALPLAPIKPVFEAKAPATPSLSLMDDDIPKLKVPIITPSKQKRNHLDIANDEDDDFDEEPLLFVSTLKPSDVHRENPVLAQKVDKLHNEIVLLRREQAQSSAKLNMALSDISSSLKAILTLLDPASTPVVKVEVTNTDVMAYRQPPRFDFWPDMIPPHSSQDQKRISMLQPPPGLPAKPQYGSFSALPLDEQDP